MALYEFIINNVIRVEVCKDPPRRVIVYYSGIWDVSRVGDFPPDDYCHVHELVDKDSKRILTGKGVEFSIEMDADPFLISQCEKRPVETVRCVVREADSRIRLAGQWCPTTERKYRLAAVTFGKDKGEEKDMRGNYTTVDDVYKSMTDAQQKVCQFMISEALQNGVKSFTPDSIKKVIYNDPATIIFWSDGTKTIVKCMEGEDYDPEKGFMAAVTKKVFGDKYGWVMRHQVKPAAEYENKVDTLMESIADALRRKRNAQDSVRAIRDQMLVSGATNWELETFDRFMRKYIADKEDK